MRGVSERAALASNPKNRPFERKTTNAHEFPRMMDRIDPFSFVGIRAHSWFLLENKYQT